MGNLDWLNERPVISLRKGQCQAVIQPGEFLIDTWDNKQCRERKRQLLIRCEGCKQLYCAMKHWHMHLDSVPADHFGPA